MADPTSKDATLQRTYLLTVPVHDLMGDAPVAASSLSIRLFRIDGQSTNPLFGPQGVLAGDTSLFAFAAEPRDPSMISAGLHQFRLIPNDYYFVPTMYRLIAGGRSYEFLMPAADSNLIELVDAVATPSMSVTPGRSSGLVLPSGSAVNTELRWSEARSMWMAVSGVTSGYLGVTQTATFTDIRAMLLSLAAAGDNQYGDPILMAYASNRYAYNDLNTAQSVRGFPDSFLDNLWPPGAAAPFAWVLVPSPQSWLANFRFTMRPSSGVTTTVSFTRLSFDMVIDGVLYEVGAVQVSVDPRADFYMTWLYVQPPTSQLVVTESARP